MAERPTTYRAVPDLINFLALPMSKNANLRRCEREELIDALSGLNKRLQAAEERLVTTQAEIDCLSRGKAEIKQEVFELAERLKPSASRA